jgi:hypothetical protein
LIDEHAMPYLERFTSLEAVLDEVIRVSTEQARESGDPTFGYFRLSETALLRWRLGDLAGAEADLERADASITRPLPRKKRWYVKDESRLMDQQIDEEFYSEHKAFVRGVRNFVRHHDPTQPVTRIPLWPGLDNVTRTWRAGKWRKRTVKMPWTEPTLMVLVHDEDLVGMAYGPVEGGSGEAWLGPGPAYFDDDAVYDVDSAADGLAAWALSATGAQPDISALRALITPASSADLIEALTELCRLLNLALPKN